MKWSLLGPTKFAELGSNENLHHDFASEFQYLEHKHQIQIQHN